ncbi:MAG: SDR family oxidoreductase [Planctomycetota bacterium]|jgi:citronellol/citronellal dehydrogenase
MPYDSIFRPGLFEDNVVLITGGGSGIGRAIAHELAHLGARVVLAARNLEKLEAVKAEIEEDGGQAHAIACNIRDEEAVKACIAGALSHYGRLDGLVNNAGGQFLCPVDQISTKGFKAVVETNLVGTFLMSREAFSQHMSKHGGAIVNIVAEMWRGMPMMAHSGAARAGVVNLTKSMALEWAAQSVRVNAVAPGYILSSGLKNYPDYAQSMIGALSRDTPAARLGTESEVASAVVFLLSPGGRFINGDTIRVDGASSLYKTILPIPEHDPLPAYDGFHRAVDAPEALSQGAQS